jgi:type IV secretory pathway VirB9-like protein
MTSIVLIASALVIGGCAAQQAPPPAPYVPVTVTNPPPEPIDAGPDPVAALPEDIRVAYMQPDPPIVHDGITTIYPYDPHQQPIINCAILRVTEIVLGTGETVKANDIGIGDSVRWSVTAADNRILVKPAEPGIATDLVVVTNLRSYHFGLRTHSPYQPQVSFYYPEEIAAAEGRHRELLRQAIVQSQAKPWSKPLNFGYAITGPDVA